MLKSVLCSGEVLVHAAGTDDGTPSKAVVPAVLNGR